MDPAAHPPPGTSPDPPTERLQGLPPTPSPAPPPPPRKRPPIAPVKDLLLADSQASEEQIFQLKGALLTVSGGIIAATVALLSVNAQREEPMAHTDFLVASLLFGCVAMALVLVALAHLDLRSPTGHLVRKLAVTNCILAILPLVLFAWSNFSPNRTDIQQKDLFGVRLTPQQRRQVPKDPDPGLVAVVTTFGNAEAGHDPRQHMVTESRLAPLAVRIATPLLTQPDPPSATAVEEAVAAAVALELTPLVEEIRDFHQKDKFGALNGVNIWEHPELDNFLVWSGHPGVMERWATDDEAS
ncbi:MAG TPA: hypothetical protein VEI97_05640, partial [bacterium]|nr:hypothetical protein [bacterium]